MFLCPNCNQTSAQSKLLGENYFLNILAGYGFACPSQTCDAKQMVLSNVNIVKKDKSNKKKFVCKACRVMTFDSINLVQANLSKYSLEKSPIKSFAFEDDVWDIRAINTLANNNRSRYILNFSIHKNDCLKLFYKKYIYHLCQLNKHFSTLDKHLIGFRQFSDYLLEKNISYIEQINRDLILDFMVWGNTTDETIRTRLRSLKQLFTTGNIRGWFQIDPDIIRNSDYPKRKISNPDPIPDIVREQIEKKLHKLPDPIARMWIVCFFAAMRPYELALLKKNCLEQVGDKWKLIWWRKKGKTFHQHSVPITITIAKVIQEQIEYIENLWGKDWEYLFCHYHNVSQSDPTHPKLQPVRKVIPRNGNPLQNGIRTLIVD